MYTDSMDNYNHAALLVIDVQVGIDELFSSGRNNPTAEDKIANLIRTWRESGREVIHVKHNSTEPGSPLRPELPGNDFKPQCKPQGVEKVFEKTVNSAFIGTGLENYLRESGINDLVIVGLTTDHCVSTTTRMAANLGFDVVLVGDATATFGRKDRQGKEFTAEEVHAVNLLSLDGEFCQVVSSDEILQQA